MRTSTDLDILAELEGVPPQRVDRYNDAPIVILEYATAGNDATCEDPTSYDQHQAARAHRSFVLGTMIIAWLRAARAVARRAYEGYRRRRDAKAVYDALRGLDDRTLRDLGFDRSEITSIAAEVTGQTERTRVRALLSH